MVSHPRKGANMPLPRTYNAPTKNIVFVQENNGNQDQDWTPTKEEERCEESESGSEGEQSIYSDSCYSSDDEKEVPQQAQSLKNVIQQTQFQTQAQVHKQKQTQHFQPAAPQQIPHQMQNQQMPSRGNLKRKHNQTAQTPHQTTQTPEPRKHQRQYNAEESHAEPNRSNHRKRPRTSTHANTVVSEAIDVSRNEVSGETLEASKVEKKETLFDLSNVDYNLYTAAPQNIVEKKVMLGNNLLVLSKMMEAAGDKGQTYEYAAISFQRKLKSSKAYTFNIPLNLAPTLIKALELIMDDNKTFFSSH